MKTNYSIEITCSDFYKIYGQFYPSHQPLLDHYPVLIAPATGITTNFYHAFATWLSEQGFNVLSFDFRGIGKSLHGQLKNSKANIIEWGQLDLPAAIDKLLSLTQSKKVILIGHSAGGQLTGIIPNYHKIAKVISISGSSGYIKGLKGRTKLLAPILFKCIFPITRYTLGYGPLKFIGMGENLPKNVAKQWAEFCNHPGYVINALGKSLNENQNFHRNITQPITVIWALDDEIATKSNIDDLLKLYPNAPKSIIQLNPKTYNFPHIGHMLMFKSSHKKIWSIIKEQLIL